MRGIDTGRALHDAPVAGGAADGVGQRRREHAGRHARRTARRGRGDEPQGGQPGRPRHHGLVAVRARRAGLGVDHHTPRPGGDLPRGPDLSADRADHAGADGGVPRQDDHQPERAAGALSGHDRGQDGVHQPRPATRSSPPHSGAAVGSWSWKCTATATCMARRSACSTGVSPSLSRCGHAT